MTITEDFVLINYPKTGTTFTRSAIALAYGVKCIRLNRLMQKFCIRTSLRELQFPKLYGNYDSSYRDQHGVYRQIPIEDRGKRIVSIVRNPIHKYISSYVYGWWKNHPPYSLDLVVQDFPKFPDISFPEFYDLVNHPNANEDKISVPEARAIGSYTRMFLVFFSEDPDAAAAGILSGKSLADVIPRVTFLHQEALRDNLCLFLKEVGVSASKAEKIYRLNKKNVSSIDKKSKLSTKEIEAVARRIITDEEKFLGVFPEYLEQLNKSIREGVYSVESVGCEEPRTLGV
ncbi:hypothetical protein [Cerasicoccus maritimus]|uniref:hypothetical protein n=1 Tax=Cerasicoccus maritimus TaxID=490089 RepID=UPI0028527CCC|nr:hypothetical protein [Cerasicoccus maritimus]